MSRYFSPTYTCSDSSYSYHNGESYRIVRRLKNRTEVDEADVGRMYLIRFKDGEIIHAFADEIMPIRAERE